MPIICDIVSCISFLNGSVYLEKEDLLYFIEVSLLATVWVHSLVRIVAALGESHAHRQPERDPKSESESRISSASGEKKGLILPSRR